MVPRPVLAAAFLGAALALAVPLSGAEELVAQGEAWHPYMGPSLPEGGFIPALLARCLADTGRSVRAEFYPWARALAAVREGKADILMGAYRSAERDAWFVFSAPIAEVSDSLFALKRSGLGTYGSLRDLSPRVVGVVRGAAHGAEFDGATYLIKEEAESAATNIDKLLAGRVQLIAGPREVIRAILRERYPASADQVVELRPVLQTNPVHFAFSRRRADAAELAGAVDAAVKRLRATGAYAELAKRYGIAP